MKSIIFGTGIDALRCMDKLEFEPEYFIVNNCKHNEMVGIEIRECNLENVRGKFVYVATRENTYSVIKNQLEEYGLKEFENFIYYTWAYKKLMLFHGNCHFDVIESMCRSSSKFMEQFAIYPNPRIFRNAKNEIGDNVLQHIDYYVHQDIRDENMFGYKMSDSFTCSRVSDGAKCITNPNLYGLGKFMFPYSGKILETVECRI